MTRSEGNPMVGMSAERAGTDSRKLSGPVSVGTLQEETRAYMRTARPQTVLAAWLFARHTPHCPWLLGGGHRDTCWWWSTELTISALRTERFLTRDTNATVSVSAEQADLLRFGR